MHLDSQNSPQNRLLALKSSCLNVFTVSTNQAGPSHSQVAEPHMHKKEDYDLQRTPGTKVVQLPWNQKLRKLVEAEEPDNFRKQMSETTTAKD